MKYNKKPFLSKTYSLWNILKKILPMLYVGCRPTFVLKFSSICLLNITFIDKKQMR